mmetsp:Transcript_35420/g.101806  ORF Transcript_35420/g.101806 Transcript_35420/m.101806 type:complete len:503 (-) Transcript_35420:304-1812(-)
MEVCSTGRVRLLGEHQGLLHALLCVVYPEKCPDALGVEEAIRQVHLSHLIEPLGRLLEVSSVPVDAGLAGVDLHERGRVLHGAVRVLQRPLGVSDKVEVVRGDHEGEEQARGRLLPRGVAGAGAPVLLAHGGAEPGDGLLEVAQVAHEELLHERRLVALEVERPHHAEERGDALAQPRAQVVVQPALEAPARDEVEAELLQGVGPGVLRPEAVEEVADGPLLLLRERHQRLLGLDPALVLPAADGDPALDPHGVLRLQPAPHGHALGVHGLREGADRGGRRAPGLELRGPRGGQRRPEALELGLAGHVGQGVDLVLGVHAHEPPEDLRGLALALEEHAQPALHLQQPDLVHDALLVLPQALQGLLQLPGLLHDRGPVHEELGVLVLGNAVVLEGLLVVLYAGPRKLVALAEVLCDRISHPIQAIGGLHLQELPPRLGEPSQVLTVDLQQGQVTQDLEVVRIDPQSLAVALYSLLVVLVLAMEQPEDVPANMAFQVVLEPLPH